MGRYRTTAFVYLVGTNDILPSSASHLDWTVLVEDAAGTPQMTYHVVVPNVASETDMQRAAIAAAKEAARIIAADPMPQLEC